MIFERNIKKYSISSDSSIKEALIKIESNKNKTIFIVSPSDYIEGSLTDGDIRRWLVSSNETKISEPVKKVMNKKFFSIQQNSIEKVDIGCY